MQMFLTKGNYTTIFIGSLFKELADNTVHILHVKYIVQEFIYKISSCIITSKYHVQDTPLPQVLVTAFQLDAVLYTKQSSSSVLNI